MNHCEDHSGLMAWMKSIAALLVCASSLLAYSVIWQAPGIRLEIAREIARLDMQNKELSYQIRGVQQSVCTLDQRVNALELKVKP